MLAALTQGGGSKLVKTLLNNIEQSKTPFSVRSSLHSPFPLSVKFQFIELLKMYKLVQGRLLMLCISNKNIKRTTLSRKLKHIN